MKQQKKTKKHNKPKYELKFNNFCETKNHFLDRNSSCSPVP